MHEYPITQQIIKIAEKFARDNGAESVSEISLVVGDDSGFIGESIQMYFDIISEETICAGAKISIKGVRPKLKCDNCGQLFERKPFSFACPYCMGQGSPTEIGKEFYIDHIEVEKSDV